MIVRAVLALALASLAAPGMAQVRPVPSSGDPHLQTVDYEPGQVIQLRGAPGYQLMVELSPDESVETLAVGDSGLWQVATAKSGDRLVLRPSRGDGSTNLTVVTSVRQYHFELFAEPRPSLDTPFNVRFRYGREASQTADNGYVDVSAAARKLSHYRISGDRLLRPSSVSDDGRKTFVQWPPGVSLPAIYALDAQGREMLVNGMMGTDDIYVIDGAPQRLTFRLDHAVARAERVSSKRRR